MTQPFSPPPAAAVAVSKVPAAGLAGLASGAVFVLGAVLAVRLWVSAAAERLTTPEAEKPKVAVADQSEVGYCTPQFKQVLERVLHSCGLAEGDSRRRLPTCGREDLRFDQ
ncbi:MAG: hypothetical protein WDO74_03825 [Pseudomonadota bacterium]